MNAITPLDAAAKMPQRGAGQATLVEQSRAIAEVQAAVVVAQNRPRSTSAAIQEMREVCKITALADRAFFRFSRGQVVTGESVHLARELARIWGNITFGIAELARDDVKGQSEMQAFAWDLQTNARSQTVFIVPHARDTKQGPKPFTDMRDIYENNANMGARRLREMIFSVLPVWFREEAADICRQTLEDGGGQPLVTRIANCVAALEGIGVTRADIERKIGRPVDAMLAENVATLGITFKSIKRGEMQRDEEFPREAVEAKPDAKPVSKLDALTPATVAPEPPRDAEPSLDPDPTPEDQAHQDAGTVFAALAKCKTPKHIGDMQAPKALGDVIDALKAFPAIHEQVMARIEARRLELLTGPSKPAGQDAEFPGDRL